ncbi:TerB family tellurite resistance protein [Vibrio sp. SS-MA-C1-2]|uniref:tellurite resistance TerB family protein n=1 Tax=Vibrio sp. SS-MA-C1-2 TaxID=2908646 RepID=UPI001F25A8AB|nr:TerB family tellurite resistance protein [Vibrio sp. SS-MA-C1-2]UJF17698.1 TerB family tellurite resistance protein [Vibrio sp. SS-MA-C1-2]
MFVQLKSLLRQVLSDSNGDSGAVDSQSLRQAMAGLLCQVSAADHDIADDERNSQIRLLTGLLNIDQQEAKTLVENSEKDQQQVVSLFQFTNKLRDIDISLKIEFINAMWQVAYADGILDPQEEAIIRQVAELIYVDHQDFIKTKLAAQKNMASQ